MMERKLFDGWGLFITKDLSYVGFFTDDRVCLIDIEADGIQIIEKSDFKEDYLLFPTEEDMVKFRATLEKAGSGFRDKILEIMKKNSYEFEF